MEVLVHLNVPKCLEKGVTLWYGPLGRVFSRGLDCTERLPIEFVSWVEDNQTGRILLDKADVPTPVQSVSFFAFEQSSLQRT